ncbi:hypothetical protein CI610_03454 [invertebrate metagenome]|uniref:Uncharacterized protein n=1 Tax=invertebrate metagenome TaxID=1711999 RepID=A0A2H9T346_9ZZZZ
MASKTDPDANCQKFLKKTLTGCGEHSPRLNRDLIKIIVKNGEAPSGFQRYFCRHCRISIQLEYCCNANQPGMHHALLIEPLRVSESETFVESFRTAEP